MPTLTLALSAGAAALLYLQSELSVSHTVHVIIGAVLVFLAGIGIRGIGSAPGNEPAPAPESSPALTGKQTSE